MAEITSSPNKIFEEEVNYKAAVSEATFTKIGASINYILENASDFVGQLETTMLTEAQFATIKNYDETETDLFGEQAVLCGGSAELIKAGFDTLVEGGYPAELAYFECMHELKLIVDLYYEGGLSRMNYSVSDTAEYGGMSRGPKIITDETKKAMKKMLEEVQNGKFAQEWLDEYASGQPNMKRLRGDTKEHTIEKVGAKLRGMMSWVKK